MDNLEYLSTELYIDKVCINCPLKLYNKKDSKVIYGIGNIYANTILILPPYKLNSKDNPLTIISDLYTKNTSKNILEEYYITRSIKCYKSSDFNLYDSACKCCSHFCIHEICRIKPKKVIILDKNYSNIIEEFCDKYKINYIRLMNPNVMKYNDNILKEAFIKQFNEYVI